MSKQMPMRNKPMAEVFAIPLIGPVTLEDELVYYDGPLLFTVRAENGGRFLGFWAAQNATEGIFWFSPISDKRYSELLRGQLEVRLALSEPEAILEAHRDNATARYFESAWRLTSELDTSIFPESGYCLEPDDVDLSTTGFIETANVLAMRAHRTVARMIFDFGAGIHEGPASAIAGAILNAQRFVDAIAHAKLPNPKDRGAIPVEITIQTQLALRPVTESSLGIELVSVQESDLWESSLVGDSLKSLMDVVSVGSNEVALRERFTPLTGRAAKAYRSLLQSLQQSGGDIVIETGLPLQGCEMQVALRKSEIPAIITAMLSVEKSKAVPHSFNAILTGYVVSTRTFYITSLDDIQYKGKATGRGAEAAAHARLSEPYRVELLETVEYDLTGDSRSEYELIDLLPLN